MKSLQKLYKTTGTGATQTWQIFVDGSELFTKFGPEGGTIQTSARETIEGKNIGKSNETTPEEQALKEAESRFTKKLGSGYVKDKASLKAGKVDASIQGGAWPMLAKKYRDAGDKIVFPAAAQPKLDGHRCIAVFDKAGKVTLWSRKRKLISMPHVAGALEKLNLTERVLDGELYAHAKKDEFEDLTHLIKHGDASIEYHIFDAIDNRGFIDRIGWLRDVLKGAGKPLVLVDTRTKIEDEDELMTTFEYWRKAGYEGAMVRNYAGAYDGHPTHRSNNLQKIKEMDDAEFKIVGVKEGKGKLAGHAIFLVATKKNTQTEVKLAGPIAELKQYWEDPDKAIGRLLTVQFQGYTATGRLRFPVGLRLREDL